MSKNAVAEKSAEASLFCDIYRNAKMGADAILNLLPRVNDKELESELSLELSRYEEFAAEARKTLGEMGETPEEEGMFSRLMAKMGITMNTVIDKTSSHIAQMIIEGCVMGITDLQKRLNDNKDYGRAEALAKKVIAFEEDTAERMKAYL